MNNTEQAKMARNQGIESFATKNASVYAADPAMMALAAKFVIDKKAAADIAALMGADNSGFSQNKADAKFDMADFAAMLCGAAQVKLDSLGKQEIANQLHDAISYYTGPADAEAAARAQAAHDTMFTNQAIITDDYVKLAELTTLQSLITAFTDTKGTSQIVHSATPALTLQFRAAIKATDEDAKNFVKLGRKYKKANKTFFDALEAVCKTPAIAVQHTHVDVTIKDSATNKPIAGAIATLSNSKKTSASNNDGFLHFDQVGGGNATLTVTATGYQTFTMLIHIDSGKDNSFNIVMSV